MFKRVIKKILRPVVRPTLESIRAFHTKPLPKSDEELYDPHIEIMHEGNVRLIVIDDPTKKHLEYLKTNYKFHPIHLDDIVSPVQRPKIDPEKGYIFMVIHLPEYNYATKRLETREVDFFLTKQDVIIIPQQGYKPLEDIIRKLSENKVLREHYFSKAAPFLLYNIIDNLVDNAVPIVAKMERIIEEIDQKVFSVKPQDIIEQISFLRRNVIYFETMIKPELTYFSSIEDIHHELLSYDTKIYFTNISDHLKKVWDRLDDIRELVDNLSRTFEGYFSFKTNETIKVLTIFSVILMPLTLLSGIYGMNLNILPFAEHPLALAIITAMMLGIVLAMLIVFKIRKWI